MELEALISRPRRIILETWDRRPIWLARRKGIKRLIVETARAKREVFGALSTISPDVRRQLAPALRRHVNRLVVLRAKTIRLGIIASIAWFVFFYQRIHNFDVFTRSIPGFILMLSTIAMLFLPTLIADRLSVSRLTSVAATAVWTALLIAGYGVWNSVPGSQREWLNAAVALPAPAIEQSIRLLFGFGVFMLALSIIAIRQIQQERRRPDSVLTSSLLEVLAILQTKPNRWTDLSIKRDLIQELESAANAVEGDLPAQLMTGHLADDRWLKEMTLKRASALRNLKRWVLMPKVDTRDRFVEQVSNILVYVLRGDWDSMPMAEPDPVSATDRWSLRLAGLLRIVITGFLPAIALWFALRIKLLLPGPTMDYLAGAALVWALVVTISSLDPVYSAKVEAFKHLFQLGTSIKSEVAKKRE